MMPTVMYPVPGGVSQSQLLKMIMATYSVIVCMAPNAVVPHSTTTRRNKQLPTTSDCQTKIATKATTATNSMLNNSIMGRDSSRSCPGSPSTITSASATTNVTRPGRAATALVLSCHRSPNSSFQRGKGYLDTSAAPRPPPTGASFGDFGRRERALLGGGAKKLASSTVVELAVIR
jgi:hypothetical protein